MASYVGANRKPLTPVGGRPTPGQLPDVPRSASPRKPAVPTPTQLPDVPPLPGGRAASPSPRKPAVPTFNRPDSAGTTSSRPNSARDMDRIRGVQGTPVEVPWRNLMRDLPESGPSPAKRAADALAAEQKRVARQRQEALVKMEAKREKDAFAARIKREKEARERTSARKKASELASERARTESAQAAQAARAKYIAEEAEARKRLQKVLDEESEGTPRGARMSDEEVKAAAKRMRDRWRAAAPPPPEPRDPYAEWRTGTSKKKRVHTRGNEEDDDSEDLDDDDDPGQGATEEEIQLAMARKAKAKERDLAAKRVLSIRSKTLTDALGLAGNATDAEVESTVRKLLRLLHPDYSINLLIKGTRRHQRIEAAFKRLNGLRNDALP